MPAPTADDLHAAVRQALDAASWSAAESLITQGLALAPEHVELLKLRFVLNLRRGHWRRAFQAFDAFVRRLPYPGLLHDDAEKLAARFLNNAERRPLYLGCFAVVASGF